MPDGSDMTARGSPVPRETFDGGPSGALPRPTGLSKGPLCTLVAGSPPPCRLGPARDERRRVELRWNIIRPTVRAQVNGHIDLGPSYGRHRVTRGCQFETRRRFPPTST